MESGISKPENDETPSLSMSILEVELLNEAREAFDLANSKHQGLGALKKIQELCGKHHNSGLLFGTQAQILHDICYSANMNSSDMKKTCIESAIYCARKSTEFSPNSMVFWSFLGYLLYKSSISPDECMEAFETFNTALKISKPTDPQEESPISFFSPTYKERIKDVRQDILNYLEGCVFKLMALGVDSSIIKLKLLTLNVKKQEKVKLYWSSLSLKEKQNYLIVDIGDLISSLVSSLKHSTKKVLLQALSFYGKHKKWEFWMCCCCHEIFPNSSLHFIHVTTTHLKELLSRLVRVNPVRVSDWVFIINKIKWLPIDTSAVLTMLTKKQQLPLKRAVIEPKDWTFSADLIRTNLLNMIRERLQELLLHNFLLPVHMDILGHRAFRKLDGLFGSLVRDFRCNRTHHCLCYLDATQLEEIFRFLQEMSNFTTSASTDALASTSASWRKITGMKSIMEDDSWPFEINGEVSVSLDKLNLLLHEDSLSNESFSGSFNEDWVNTDEHALGTSDPVDNLISWIYSDHSLDNDMKKWGDLRAKKRDHGNEEFIQYEKRLTQSLRDLHEFPEEVSIAVIPTDLEGDKDKGFSLQKPQVDTSIQAPIRKESANNDSELSNIDKQILQFAVDMHQLEIILNCSAAYSYQPIVLSIMKQYIRVHLFRHLLVIFSTLHLSYHSLTIFSFPSRNVWKVLWTRTPQKQSDKSIGKDLVIEEVRHPLERKGLSGM